VFSLLPGQGEERKSFIDLEESLLELFNHGLLAIEDFKLTRCPPGKSDSERNPSRGFDEHVRPKAGFRVERERRKAPDRSLPWADPIAQPAMNRGRSLA
jgi:hypothetical protein